MKPTIKIDYVSDIACPWCAVGFGNLNIAINDFSNHADFEIHFRPFELNPEMPKGGQDAVEHLTQKYGISEDQVRINQANIRERARLAGFIFDPDGRKRVYNTFNAHRLLCWSAKEYGFERQLALKKELFNSYFCLDVNFDDDNTLFDAVVKAGLSKSRANEILNNHEFSDDVRREESAYKKSGIHSVPSIILNERYLLEGALPADAFIKAFERLVDQ